MRGERRGTLQPRRLNCMLVASTKGTKLTQAHMTHPVPASYASACTSHSLPRYTLYSSEKVEAWPDLPSHEPTKVESGRVPSKCEPEPICLPNASSEVYVTQSIFCEQSVGATVHSPCKNQGEVSAQLSVGVGQRGFGRTTMVGRFWSARARGALREQ
jgi:hypothetical protein